MRILQVRFKNLNSLVGEWGVDFTDPAYASAGIFAITGPTGSGKTTLLDAICLALYGRTPRLDSVNKSGNEIMSRQTGECFAEVTFETQKGRFRCGWSQRRARKKFDGNLQDAEHEIADAESGKVLTEKKTGVRDRIVEITGLDFERFSRSMLLAQGGFDAFLKADEDKRAPILEQITGTAIYSAISARVHERYSEERKKLENYATEQAGLQLLGEEAEREIVSELNEKEPRATETQRRIQRIAGQIEWLDGIERLEEESRLLARQSGDLAERLRVFEPERGRLDRAERALALEGEYSRLDTLRREQDADGKGLCECQTEIPGLEAEMETARQELERAALFLTEKRTARKQLTEITHRVRELDSRIGEREIPLERTRASAEETRREIRDLHARNAESVLALQTTQADRAAILSRIEESRADAGLVENLAHFRGQLALLVSRNAEANLRQEELEAARNRKRQADLAWEEKGRFLKAGRKELEDTEETLRERRQALQTTLAGKDLAEWRTECAGSEERGRALARIQERFASLLQDRKVLGDLKDRLGELLKRKEDLAGHLQLQGHQKSELEGRVGLLETQLDLVRRIRDLETERAHLRDGEPCPLCGATEHPYAVGNLPLPDRTQEDLSRARTELKQVAEAFSGLERDLVRVEKDLEQNAEKSGEIEGRMAEEAEALTGELTALKIESPVLEETLSPVLSLALQENDRIRENAVSLVLESERLEKAIEVLRDSRQKVHETLARVEQEVLVARQEQSESEREVGRIEKEAGALSGQVQALREAILHDLSPYGVTSLSLDSFESLLEALTSRRDQWLGLQDRKAQLENRIATLETEIRHQGRQAEALDVQLKKEEETLDLLVREQEALRKERGDIFGDRDPNAEDRRFADEVESAEKRLEAAREILASVQQRWTNARNRIESYRKKIEERAVVLGESETSLGSRLTRQGFDSESHFLESRLSQEEREDLNRKSEELNSEGVILAARLRDNRENLETERRKRLADHSREELIQEREGAQSALTSLLQEIGALRQRLRDNDERKRTFQDRAEAIVAQQKECARWAGLHDLIGSADGKKFRNFAQGLTFEMLIGQANRQLEKMTDRYFLTRGDGDNPLGLSVQDRYQAGEVRSTRNLSGGESFIVSLALALGLSQIASRNVRVDSLFLDEGFGTLDEEALETALETLSGLQQDGKLIGVISHVTALKERITTQIEVTPTHGGRSTISGPGCRRL